MTLGSKIKMLRTDKGLTQKDLADEIHVTFQTISKWENDENEPDISTLKKLAKLFNVTVDFLIDQEDQEVSKEEVENDTISAPIPVEEPAKTIIIHQKEPHVCARCLKDIPEDDLAIDVVRTRGRRKGRSASYSNAYYHKACLDELNKEREEANKKEIDARVSKNKKICFGWGIAAGIIALGIALAIFLSHTEDVHPALGVIYSILIGYGLFSMVYCILSGSYIGAVFAWCAKLSVKFPGIIFTWDLDGFVFLIAMKILFAIIGFLIGVLALAFAITFSALLGGISFPFILIHNNETFYKDSLWD